MDRRWRNPENDRQRHGASFCLHEAVWVLIESRHTKMKKIIQCYDATGAEMGLDALHHSRVDQNGIESVEVLGDSEVLLTAIIAAGHHSGCAIGSDVLAWQVEPAAIGNLCESLDMMNEGRPFRQTGAEQQQTKIRGQQCFKIGARSDRNAAVRFL